MITEEAEVPHELHEVLSQFDGVFTEPQMLPPIREIEPPIVLKKGSEAKHQSPYRYSHSAKREIYRIVEDLLKTWIIQPSRSPFASPVILVKKKGNSWRMCVDYKYLNAMTKKHDYPIPVIHRLLDELHGAMVFSKIDLRFGYFQIRMKAVDCSLTTFQTHNGHYEFKVMPFGVCNAPTTFRSLTNQVFRPYLRKFFLMFFDDILIYSKSWEEHLQHLTVVLKLLRHISYMLKCLIVSLGRDILSTWGT